MSRVLWLVLLSNILVLSADAVDRYWVSSSGSGKWSVASNWSPAGPPENGDQLYFETNNTVDLMTNDIPELTVDGLIFYEAKVLYGYSLTTTGPIVQHSTGNSSVILNIPTVRLANSILISSTLSAGGITLNCQILLNGWEADTYVTDVGGGVVRFQSSVTGEGTLVCTSGTNIYLSDFGTGLPTPHVLVTGGQLNLDCVFTNAISKSLEIGPNGVVNFLNDNQIDWEAKVLIHSGGALRLGKHFNYFLNLEMQGGLLDCDPVDGSILIADEFRVNATNETAVIKGHCTISTATSSAYDPHPRLIVNGPIYPALDLQATVYGLGGFSKSGNGAMYLSVSNYFLGELVISNGIVEARNDHALGRDYTNSTVPIRGIWLEGGTLLLRNVAIFERDLHVDQSVNSSGTIGLPGAFITCVGDNVWSGGVILNTNLDLVGDINFSGAISGPGGLGFVGGGTSYLGGPDANSYTGLTLVRCPLLELYKTPGVKAYAGNLEVGGGTGGDCEVRWLNSYQNLYATVTLFDNGILNLNNCAEDLGPITFNGGTIKTGTGELGIYGLVTANDAEEMPTISGHLGLPSGNREFRVLDTRWGLSIDAAISGSGQLTKTGRGYLGLSGANTYTGLTLVSEGTLSADSPTALGTDDLGTIVADGASLDLGGDPGGSVVPEQIFIRGQGLAPFYDGALRVFGRVQLRRQLPSFSDCLYLTTNATIQVYSNATLLADGSIGGFGPLTKIGQGTLIYTNNNPNTYSGATIIQEGRLELHKPNDVIGVPGQLVLGPGTASVPAIARWFQTGGIPVGGIATVNANSLMDLNGFNQNLSQLNLNDGGSVQTATGTLLFSGGGTINIGTSNGPIQGLRQGASITGKLQLPSFDTLYCNVINYGPAPLTSEPELAISATISGTGSVNKNGGGALRLTGNNTFDGTAQLYSGEVDVMAGVVIAGSATALGGTKGETYVANGASLALINNIAIVNETLVLDSTNNAALDNRGGDNIWYGPIQLSRNSGVSVAQGWYFLSTGVISGPGGLTKWGAGGMYLTGSANNSYGGDTSVNEGTLLLAKPDAITAVPGFLVVGESTGGGAPAIAQNLASYQVYSGIIVNSQGLYDINGWQENTDYLGLNGNARVETGAGFLSLKTGASIAVTPGTNTTAVMNGHIHMDTGNHVFTVDSGAGTNDLLINAQIDQISTAAGIQKAGLGKMRLVTNNTYTGTTTVSGGTLQVDGSQPQSPVQILGARLQGSGTVGHIAFGGNAAERLAPGSSPGILTSSNLNANGVGGGTLEMELNGASPGTGYDQVNVRGTVNLTGLKLSGSLGFASTIGNQFTIINNDGSDAVTGTFSGLTQNAKVYIGGQLFRINYAGGSGNDVVLTRLLTPPPPVLTIEPESANSVLLRWPTNDPAFRLVSATNFLDTNWTQTLPLPSVIGTNNIVTNSVTPTENFYRLVNP